MWNEVPKNSVVLIEKRDKLSVMNPISRHALVLAIFLPICALSVASASTCYGTPGKGRLENGVQLPRSGPNFEPYSSLGVVAGRTHAHSSVVKTVADAYAALAHSTPEVRYVYGESGWKNGGRIEPHRTHQNGLSVDFMVPVRNADGKSVALPTNAANKFGYGIEFDAKARFGDSRIDFEAIAEHLHALYLAAEAHGIGLHRVIFEPAFIPRLYETKRGAFLRANINFMKGQAWVRHDEHYHVDFSVRCKSLKGEEARYGALK